MIPWLYFYIAIKGENPTSDYSWIGMSRRFCSIRLVVRHWPVFGKSLYCLKISWLRLPVLMPVWSTTTLIYFCKVCLVRNTLLNIPLFRNQNIRQYLLFSYWEYFLCIATLHMEEWYTIYPEHYLTRGTEFALEINTEHASKLKKVFRGSSCKCD